MSPKIDAGCGTPKDSVQKEIYRRLVELFSPVIYFHPEERFFPVDLPTSIQFSSLWAPPYSNPQQAVGQIDPQQDLPAATTSHYTTVAGNDTFFRNVPAAPIEMPAPRVDQIHQDYRNSTIPAKLTIYGTVCLARDVPNTHLIQEARDHGVKAAFLEGGLIINYYMYFPAAECAEYESEGDWSGISLLIKRIPNQVAQLNDPIQLARFMPEIACYYRKSVEDIVQYGHATRWFVAANNNGIRRWNNISRANDPIVGLPTHPAVFISQGRHNCYFESSTVTVPLYSPWQADFTPERIENGDYASGPAEPTPNVVKITGETDLPWWFHVVFFPLIPFVACATGCEEPFEFDTSGVPVSPKDEDRSSDNGFVGLPSPTGSAYPTGAPPQQLPSSSAARQVGCELKYVDLDDTLMASHWGYAGAWGAATLFIERLLSDPDNPRKWGYFMGAHRPSLSAWLVWNLFLDATFGCAGKPELTRSP